MISNLFYKSFYGVIGELFSKSSPIVPPFLHVPPRSSTILHVPTRSPIVPHLPPRFPSFLHISPHKNGAPVWARRFLYLAIFNYCAAVTEVTAVMWGLTPSYQ